MTMTPDEAATFSEIFNRLVANVEQVLLGKTFVIRLGFTALLSEGTSCSRTSRAPGRRRWRARSRSPSPARATASSSRPTCCPATSPA